MTLKMVMILKFWLIISNFLGEFAGKLTVRSKTHNILNYRVCSKPTHIEARNVNDKISSFGTQAVLIYDWTPKPAAERTWAYGISPKSG